MTRANQQQDVRAAAASAAQLVQKLTCEGCAHLRALRPMCMGETSPHYRQPRESFHTQCGAYVPRGAKQAVKTEPQPASRAQIAGEVARRKHNRWRRAEA